MATPAENAGAIPTTLASPGALRFWLAVCLIGVTTGLAAAALTRLLEVVQQIAWRGSGTNILDAARQASVPRHLIVLLAAAVLTGAGQLLLKRLSSGNGIDTTAAIWFHAGRLPAWRTLGSAVLSIFDVAMGASMGREGAPKQAGAVFANLFADTGKLSDEQRSLLVACGAGAGMGAAYGVPLGGALFSLEVMRGKLALRFVLPALLASLIATGVSWIFLPNAPTYAIPSFPLSASGMVWAIVAAPFFAFASILYVRLVRWADRGKPRGWQRFIAPVIVLGLLGGLRAISRDTRQRQRPFAVDLCQSGWVAPRAGPAVSETAGHDPVHAQWRSWRPVYPLSHLWCPARRCARVCLERAVARRASGIFRIARRWRCSVGYHSGANFRSCPDVGAYRQGQIFHFAADSNRCPLDTYCPFC